MMSTAFFSRNRFARSSRYFAASALLIGLAGCDVQPPNVTSPDASGVFSCSGEGYVDCDNDDANGCETNINTDENNCGACGTSCTSPRVCMNGTCDFDNTNCPGADLATDPDHCGSCGNSIDDKNDCTNDGCVDGIPRHLNRGAGEFCSGGNCDANGVCIRLNAYPCTNNAQCKSGICTDGVCCDRACDGTCESCKKAETGFENGTCWPILALTDPANECPTGECNGVGQCIVPNSTCATSADCTSGFCADGYCCDSPCTESCMTCNAPNNLGSCVPVAIFDTDPNAPVPCSEPMVACNGSGVCKGGVGKTCVTNSDCLSGYCDAGLCSFSMMQLGPLAWQWHVEEKITSATTDDFTFPDLFVSDMVATDDGQVRVVGTYFHPIFGMPSGGYDQMLGMQYAYYHNDTGPHAFVFDLDANAQAGTFQQYFAESNWLDKVAGEYTDKGRYAKGPKLRIIGGDKALYFEGWKYGPFPKGGSSDVCEYGHLIKSAAPSWSLGNTEICALQASSFAGNEAGNTFLRHSGGVTHYDPAGQLVQTLADPFNGSEGELAIGPQGELHLGARDKLALHIRKADASGMLQWYKKIHAPMLDGHKDCFSHALDATGNVLLAFHSKVVVDLDNGPLPVLGPVDLILAKLNPQGNLIWSKRFGGADFTVKSCRLKSTGLDHFALFLDYTGTVDLGAGVLPSSPVLVEFDALANAGWRVDLASLIPFVPERTTWTLAGHPSGAVFVSGTGYEPAFPTSTFTRNFRFFVAKFGP